MKVILYTKNFNQSIKEPVNIILSPEFYWIQKIDAPIKTILEAKKIAKNLFKLNSDQYFFDAIKINNIFFAIALNKKLNLKIDSKFIQNIYLSQELIEFNEIAINDESILKNVNGIMFILPKKDNNIKKFDEIIDKIKLKNKISLYSEKIDNKIIIPIFIFVLSINIYFFQNIYSNYKTTKFLEAKRASMLKKSSLPLTSYQLNSILKKLEKENKEQIKLRKKLEFISKNSPKKLRKLSFNNNKFNIEIENSKNLDYIFNKEFMVHSILKNKIYKAELTYE